MVNYNFQAGKLIKDAIREVNVRPMGHFAG